MEAKTYLKPQYLHACSLIAAKGDIRWYLNGVFVEIEEQATRYVATDGHKMLILRDPREKQDKQTPATLIIPNEAIALIPKRFKEPTLGVELRYDTEPGKEGRIGNIFFKPLEG